MSPSCKAVPSYEKNASLIADGFWIGELTGKRQCEKEVVHWTEAVKQMRNQTTVWYHVALSARPRHTCERNLGRPKLDYIWCTQQHTSGLLPSELLLLDSSYWWISPSTGCNDTPRSATENCSGKLVWMLWNLPLSTWNTVPICSVAARSNRMLGYVHQFRR